MIAALRAPSLASRLSNPFKKKGGVCVADIPERLFLRELLLLDVAGSAVARAALQRGCPFRAGGRAIHLASLLHGAFDAHALHIFVGRDFGVDVVSFEDEGQG